MSVYRPKSPAWRSTPHAKRYAMVAYHVIFRAAAIFYRAPVISASAKSYYADDIDDGRRRLAEIRRGAG